jgi:hypothetical protein
MYDHIGLKVRDVDALEDILLIQQFTERSAVPAGPPLSRARSSSVRDFLGAAACLATWVVLWLLSIFAVTSPRFEREGLDALIHVGNDSAPLGDPARSCPSGMFELEGGCFLGEEVEVRPP